MATARVPADLRLVPFTGAQGAAAGVSRSALRGKQWRRLLRDVWVHYEVPDSRALRLAAVRLVLGPNAFICGPTAAWVYGIDVQDIRNELIWIGYRGSSRPRTQKGCRIQKVSVSEDEIQVVEGVAITTPLRTALDCARWLPMVEGVVVADALAHDALIDLEEFATLVAQHRGLRGIRTADRVVQLADKRSESPMESRVRVLLIEGGLPAPEPQVVIEDENGDFVARADLAYRLKRLAIEYDGAWHFTERARDERRRQAMRDLGWTVIVLTSEDYYEWPKATVSRVSAKLAALS